MPLESQYSNQVQILVEDTMVPAIVQDFVLSEARQGASFFTWTANTEDNLAGYKIYRKFPEETEFTLLEDLADPLATSFEDATVKDGTTYDYAITAYDTSGNEGEKAELLKINTVPSVPQNLLAESVNGTVVLTWDSVKDAEDEKLNENLSGYNIYRSETDGEGYVNIGSAGADETTFTDDTVEVGKTYFYVITAFDNSQ